MAWWNFWRRDAVDRVDGYEPPSPSTQDPWQDPAVSAQIARRRDQSHMDAEAYDGFVNELTGIGNWLQDKTYGGKIDGPTFSVRLLPGVACEDRWRGSDLGGRIVETIPDEMTREGWDLQIQPSDDDKEPAKKADAFPMAGMPPELMQPPTEPPVGELPEIDDSGTEAAEEINGILETLGAADRLWDALCYERAFGGGAILIGADDGQADLSKPLDEKRIRSIRWLNAFRGGWDGELVAWSYYRDPTEPKYGQPETYMLRNLGVPIARIPVPGEYGATTPVIQPGNTSYGPLIYWVHESRLLIFPGVSVSRRALVQMRGWGDSVFTRVDEVLSQYSQTWGGVANLLTDFSQGVLKIKDLAQAMGANNKTANANLTNRARTLQATRSISRLLLIDADEEFGRDTATLAGIAEVLQQFALRLAAAADMPVALLMGQAPAGLNATGASDIRFFYDRVAAKQKKRMLPQLRRLIKLIMLAKDSPTDGAEMGRWNIKFRPLYQETGAERAARVLQVAQADQIYINGGVVTGEEVAATRFGGSDYNDGPIVIDFDGRKKMAEQDAKDKEERKKALMEQMNNKQTPPGSGSGDPKATDPGEPKTGGGGHTVRVTVSPNK